MDTRTGNLYSKTEMEHLDKEFKIVREEFVEIDPDFATKMQMLNKKVSLKDHKSKLGKQLTHERKVRNFHTRKK